MSLVWCKVSLRDSIIFSLGVLALLVPQLVVNCGLVYVDYCLHHPRVFDNGRVEHGYDREQDILLWMEEYGAGESAARFLVPRVLHNDNNDNYIQVGAAGLIFQLSSQSRAAALTEVERMLKSHRLDGDQRFKLRELQSTLISLLKMTSIQGASTLDANSDPSKKIPASNIRSDENEISPNDSDAIEGK